MSDGILGGIGNIIKDVGGIVSSPFQAAGDLVSLHPIKAVQDLLVGSGQQSLTGGDASDGSSDMTSLLTGGNSKGMFGAETDGQF